MSTIRSRSRTCDLKQTSNSDLTFTLTVKSFLSTVIVVSSCSFMNLMETSFLSSYINSRCASGWRLIFSNQFLCPVKYKPRFTHENLEEFLPTLLSVHPSKKECFLSFSCVQYSHIFMAIILHTLLFTRFPGEWFIFPLMLQ